MLVKKRIEVYDEDHLIMFILSFFNEFDVDLNNSEVYHELL